MEQNIFRFEISVDNVVFVHILNSCANLSNVLFHCPLGDFSILLQVLIQVLAQARLKD